MSEPGPVRDIAEAALLHARPVPRGRRVIAVIGIDAYARWPRLRNAVSDARAIEQAFVELGFETVTPSLFDAQATRAAIDDWLDALERGLTSEDHLVVFFAGHGGTSTRRAGTRDITTGYLIPVDGTRVEDRPASLFELDSFLLRISRLSALHIVVILDACYSGLALAPSSILQRPRGGGGGAAHDPYARLHARMSRMLIASTLDNEQAQDGSATPGHSLFTACLLHALAGDMERIDLGDDQRGVHASSLGVFVRDHVYLDHFGARQTPDFGRFGNDDRGDMPIVLARGVAARGSTPRLAEGSATLRRAGPASSGLDEPDLAAILPLSRTRPIALAALAVFAATGGIASVAVWHARGPQLVAAVLEPREAVLVPERTTRGEPAPPPRRPLSVIRTASSLAASARPPVVVAKCPVDISSRPKGAVVKRDGVKIGITPMHLELPCAEAITLSFHKADHNPSIKQFVPGDTPAFSTQLKLTVPRSEAGQAASPDP